MARMHIYQSVGYQDEEEIIKRLISSNDGLFRWLSGFSTDMHRAEWFALVVFQSDAGIYAGQGSWCTA